MGDTAMKGLIFIGMLGPASHNPEERRFVAELAPYFDRVHYLRGIGVKGLGTRHLRSLPARLAERRSGAGNGRVARGSLLILPLRRWPARPINVAWLRGQLNARLGPGRWTLWTRFPSPELIDAVASLPLHALVYEPIDRYSAAANFSPRERRRIRAAEGRLLERATVITGGQLLAQEFRNAAGGSHWLPFGLDLARESSGPGLPTGIGRPRLAVIGGLDWRLDEELLLTLAIRHPGWQLVFVGPRTPPWGRLLEGRPNVHWLGTLPAARVGPVVADADVALIPYRETDWTRACLPVKVFEYLAQGKPVIATPLPELEPFGDVITVARAADFPGAVLHALRVERPEIAARRRQAALRFTLQDRARRAAALLDPSLAQVMSG
jgi:glycosyltransferase involved in cell wall biosynthesis